ncbi:MAG: hypothetical protein HOP08_00695 [Cyclobacteriaceae bacterium]|nr:hypothetical protein [Cyclobacteriaceae bacterium]
MNHLSIAIIRTKSLTIKAHFDYLIIEEGNKIKFFETVNIAIGGSFDFSSFKKQIIQYFNLPQTIEIDGTLSPVDFENPPTLFKSSPRDPEATAYLYEFSAPQRDAIILGQQSNSDYWKNIKWIPEADLNSNQWIAHQSYLFERESPFNPPKFSNEYRASIKKIVSAKQTGKLVIFAGAGVSIDSNVPLWRALVDEMKNDLSTHVTDIYDVPDLYYHSRGEKEFHEKVREISNYGKTKFNGVHKKIITLNPVHVITTNYDTHFEQVVENLGLPFSIIRADLDLPYSRGNSLIVKMHGDFDLRNIVLRKTEYDNYEKDFSLILSFIRECFASKLILFIGFSFTDENLKRILNSVKVILEKDIQRPYLYNASSEKDSTQMKESLDQQGIRLLTHESAIDDYFNQIKTSEDQEAIKELSAKGQNTYKFLKVLEEFDPISDSLENLDIQNQFIKSLERFESFGAIPIEILEKITPFKLKHHPKSQHSVNATYSHYEPFHLETLNEELLTYLNSRKNKEGKIDFYTYKNNSTSEQEIKISRYLKLLYSSGIHCIKRKSDTQSYHLRLNPVNAADECYCTRCLFDRFEWKSLIYALNSINAKALCKRDFYNEGLLTSYGFLKTGQLIKAFYALEEVKRESIKTAKHIDYFIACYNQKLLKPLLATFYESNFSDEAKDVIIQKIDSTDLYQILNDLPAERDVKECLKLIMENKIHSSMLSNMENEFETVKENYHNYQKESYWSSGPNHWYMIQSYFFLTSSFYHQNLLFNDENYSFSKMASIYFETMIANYTISKKYTHKIEKLPLFFGETLINFGYASDITDLFKQYRVTSLSFDGGVKSLVNEFKNFLDSGYEQTNLFGEKINSDPSYYSLIQNSHYFRNRITRTFNNFSILLLHCELEPDDVNLVIEKTINFLSVNPAFNASNSHTYFSKFINQYINTISEVNLQKLAFYVLSPDIWTSSLIPSFCNSLIVKTNKHRLFGEDFFQKLIRRTDEKREWPLSLTQTIPFYVLLQPEQQKKFSMLIDTTFNNLNNSRWEVIIKAYSWKMWNPKDQPTIFEPFFNSVAQESVSFPEYTILESGMPEGNDFRPWNHLYLVIQMIYSYNLFEAEFTKKLYSNLKLNMYQWILNPGEFNYDYFEIKWLLTFSRPEILRELKKNQSLSRAIESGLKKNYNPKVAELYYSS